MDVSRKTIISEVEDSVRRQQRSGVTVEDWVDSRKAYIDLAAYLVLIVERGDRDAAEAQEAHAVANSAS